MEAEIDLSHHRIRIEEQNLNGGLLYRFCGKAVILSLSPNDAVKVGLLLVKARRSEYLYHDNLIFAFFFLSAIEQEKKG